MSVVAFLAPQGNAIQAPQHRFQTINQASQAETAPSQAGGATAVAVAAGAAGALAGLGRTKRKGGESARISVAIKAFESELGVQDPVGFWDPLGLSADGDAGAFKRRRETELKHGRISMLATMGYITPELVGKWPAYLSPSQNLQFSDVPNGLGALSKVPLLGWVQIFIYCAVVEVAGINYRSDAPGDFGWKVLSSDDPAAKTKKLAAEIANGRLAMMAIIGMFFQDGLTGSAWGDWANYTASPLRAFENELGVQAPVGFWDPLGLAADGNVETFTRRRETELKHGRISMLATMGYITPELVGKFPGNLSPSQGLAFADVPNGLGAVSKVPAGGWLQIVAYCAFCEISGGNNRGDAPGDFGWKVLTSPDPEERKKKLAAEIANGRLAMMAIIGMFFQDGLTGSAWGDWANYTASPLRAFENELGVQAPVGFWDPLGLAADGDAVLFKRRRETEIKHGRVSMLATMGYITPELVGKFPGYLSPYYNLKFEDVPNGLAAISKVPFFGWLQIGIWCLYCEAAGLNFGYITEGYLEREAGDMGWKPPLLTTTDPDLRKKKLSAELANGRLAMMAIIGMFFQDGLTGSAWGDWANYTDSPLRAFEGELGVQAPVGFWDPLGLAADGNLEKFKRRREIEIKHGRISMLATMGYITPELTGKWPGTLSPSAGLKFSEIPNGLAAVSKVPAVGWLQVVIYCGVCEASGWNDRGEAPGDFKWKPPLLASDDAELRKKRLSAELANGRLAMMAIIGMFYQDGLTGSAWGDWANYTDSPLRAFESEFGVQAPLGFWDPVGFTKDGDTASFKRRREVEIKHGRVSMLATMGYITPEVSGKFPGFLSPINNLKFEDVPNGLAALSKVPLGGWAQILAYCFFCELEGFDPKDREPGNLGWKPPYLYSTDPDLRARRLNAEIANGRLAMMAIIGMFFQDGLTGSAWGDWANYTDSPLRAFENELGVQAPVGFFDPLDLCSDGNVEEFKRRREVEIKHGRISMLATMGYITPEITGKLPVYLDPRSPTVSCEDIPNGLGAISKVPIGGWIQIVAYMAFCEASGRNSRGDAPGDFGWKPPLLATNDPATKSRRLNAELANGRLAMMAIIGMFFQDGLTGSAWGDWSNYTASPLRAL